MSHPNYYEFLGVSRTASADEINKAFREKALILHPDKNKEDPEAATKFKMLTQAYQVLTDAKRRQKYDETLPPPELGTANVTDPVRLWQLTAKLFFDQSERFTPAVDALRYSKPITIEDDELLIVGIDPAKSNLVGYLSPAVTHNHVRNILSELYGRPLDFRMVSGTSLQEWQEIKIAEEKFRQRRANQNRPMPTLHGGTAKTTSDSATSIAITDPEEAWEEVMEAVVRQWSATEMRAYPQARARYIMDQLPVMARAEDLSRALGLPEDQVQKNLSRVIERISSLSSMDSGIVALEYLRYRARLLGGMA